MCYNSFISNGYVQEVKFEEQEVHVDLLLCYSYTRYVFFFRFQRTLSVEVGNQHGVT